MYKNCQVKITFGKMSAVIDYTAGVYQGDIMSPIFFLFAMEVLLDKLELDAQ